MRFFKFSVSFFIVIAVFNSCSNPPVEEWVELFNGTDLTGWDTYLGPRYNSDSADFVGDPVGLNNDPEGVFSVVETDDAPAIRISGEQFGGISTTGSYENYHLQLQFKWGEAKYAPRDSVKRDSGLLYHANGPHGADWRFWMMSQEFQIQEGDCGDYWGLHSDVMVRARMNEDSTYTYTPDGEPLPFGAHSKLNGNVKKYPNAEKPSGEWNTIELYTVGTTSIHIVNDIVTMILEASSQPVNGEVKPLTKGKLQIQSEGAEIFYRNIRLRSITKIPTKILQKK